MVETKFKQTEIGLIPEEWAVKKFEDFADKSIKWSITGGPFGSNLKTTDYTDSGIQIIQLQNIGDGKFINESIIYTSEQKANELLSCNIYSDDIILSKMGDPVARACMIPGKSARYIMASDGIRLVVDEKKFSKRFAFHYINSPFFRKRAIDVSTGSTRQRIGLPKLKSLNIIYPPLPEQQAIAEVLRNTDTWIESLEKLITKKRLIKQGAMQELLTPKETWEVKKLGDLTKLFTKQTGFDYSAYIKPSLVQVKSDNVIPFIQNKDFNNKKINLETDYYIPQEIALKFPKILLNEKSLLISISGSIGNIGVYELPKLAFIGGAIAILKYKNPQLIDWTMLYLKSDEGQGKLLGNIKSGSHQNLILDDIRKIEIPFPDYETQQQISNLLFDMDAEIEALENKLSKARQIKQGMMQELLTGRVRLVETIENKDAKPKKVHNDNINDAVLIATMASCFGSEQFPLTRFKYTKVSYFLKRYKEEQTTGYLKMPAGPYKPKARYGGAENIAIKNKYIVEKKSTYKGKEYNGFVKSENIDEAINYFKNWYGEDSLSWIQQFKFETNDNLELWATIDMAIQDLRKEEKLVNVESIKQIINENKEWRDKLKRQVFSDANIQCAIDKIGVLYNEKNVS